MEVSKECLDGLPKLSSDYLKGHFEEGDILYSFAGYVNLHTFSNVITIERRGSDVSFYLKMPDERKEKKITTSFCYLPFFLTYFMEGLLQSMNNSRLRNPLTMRNRDKIESVLKKGDRIARHKLIKKDGQEFEILT